MNERDQKQAESAIQRFRTRFEAIWMANADKIDALASQGHYVFAIHASFPPYFTPDLLYRLWQNFNTYQWQNSICSINPLAVSDLLLSSLCREIGHEQYELVPAVRVLLQRDQLDFKDSLGHTVLGEKRRIELAEFLDAYAKKHYIHPADKNLLTTHVWTAQSVLNPVESARDIVKALSESLEKNDTGEALRLVLLADSFQSEAFREIKSLGKAIQDELFQRPVEDKVVLRYTADNSGNATILLPSSVAARVESAMVEPPLEKKYAGETERRIAEAHNKQLLKLDLSGQELTEVPVEIFQLTQLTELDLSRNRLTQLPEGLLALTRLQRLNVRDNPLPAPWSEWMRDDDSAQIFFAWNKNPAVFTAVCSVIEAKGSRGTGFLIKGGYLITCSHMLPEEKLAGAWIEFNYEMGAEGNIKSLRKYFLDTSDLVRSPSELDFIRIKVIDNPEHPLSQWGYLEWSTDTPLIGASLNVIDHTEGHHKRFRFHPNSVLSIHNQYIYYDINNRYSAVSSGAPILNQNLQIVALHHALIQSAPRESFAGILATSITKWLNEINQPLPEIPPHPVRRYEVKFDSKSERWQIQLGLVHGLRQVMFTGHLIKTYGKESQKKFQASDLRAIQDMLLDCFERDSFERLIYEKMHLRFDDYVANEAFRVQIFNFITTANQEGWLPELLIKAATVRPDNQDAQQWAVKANELDDDFKLNKHLLAQSKITRLGVEASLLEANISILEKNQTYWGEPDHHQPYAFPVYCPDMKGVEKIAELLEKRPESPVLLVPDFEGCLFELRVESGSFMLYSSPKGALIHGIKNTNTNSAKYMLRLLSELDYRHQLQSLQNPETTLHASAVSFEIELELDGNWIVADKEHNEFPLKKDKQHFRISLGNSSEQALHAILIYLSPAFGSTVLWNSKEPLQAGKQYKVPENSKFSFSEISDAQQVLKLVVSQDAIDPMLFTRAEIVSKVEETAKEFTTEAFTSEVFGSDWFTKTFQIYSTEGKAVVINKDFESSSLTRKCLRVYVAYSMYDASDFEKLSTILTPLVQEGAIEFLPSVRDEIAPDEEQIQSIINADLILWLVSAENLDDDSFWSMEYRIFSECWKNGQVNIAPILLRPCTNIPEIEQVQTLPAGKPRFISQWENPELAWQNVVDELKKRIDSLQSTAPKEAIDAGKIKSFIVAADKDISYREALIRHLDTDGKYQIWHSGLINAGTHWDEEIKNRLNDAELIIILLSPDSLSSPYIQNVELKAALERVEKGNIRVVPIIIRPCLWYNKKELTRIPVYPDNLRAISLWEDQEEAWSTVLRQLDSSPLPRPAIKRSDFRIAAELVKEQNAVILSAKEDFLFCDELINGLQQFEQVSIWHEKLIAPGTYWEEETQNAVEKADLIFILISSFVWNLEGISWNIIAENHRFGKSRIIPVLVQPCFWYVHPIFKNIPISPGNLLPISMWKNRDEAWEKLLNNSLSIEKIPGPTVHMPFNLGENTTLKPLDIVIWEMFDQYGLDRHLAPLNQAGIIKTIWPILELSSGSVGDEMLNHIDKSAGVVVILISQHFLSDWNAESKTTQIIQMLQKRKNEGQLIVMPILVEPCQWESHPVSAFKILMDIEKPISAWSNSELAWTSIAGDIFELMLLIQEKRVEKT